MLGAPGPVTSADEVVALTKKHGIPVATKSTHGGRSQGLKFIDTLE